MENNNIIAAVPFHVDNAGELSKKNDPGFHQLIPTLKELAERTSKDYQTEKSALSSEIAQIEFFHTLLERKEEILPQFVTELELQWRKIISLFVLFRYHSTNLYVVPIKSGCNEKIWKIFGEKIALQTETIDQVYVLAYGKAALAVANKNSIWAPLAESSTLDQLMNGGIESLEAYEKNLIFSYLSKLEGIGLKCDVLIQRFMADLKNNGALITDYNKEFVFSECGENWELAQSIKNAIFTVPVPPVRVPYPFHSCLVLTMNETTLDKPCLSFTVKEGNNRVTTLYAILPLSLELAETMEENDDISIESMEVNGGEFRKNQSVEIKLTLRVKEESIQYRKCYTSDAIRYVPSMPVVAVFPYVNLPEHIWKDYNVVLKRASRYESTDDYESLKGIQRISGNQLDLLYPSVRQAKIDEPSYQWFYTKRTRLPRYICLCVTDADHEDKRNQNKKNGYLGAVPVGIPANPEQTQNAFNKEYFLAIDLGTSNTIMGLRGERDESIDYDPIKDNIYMPLLRNKITAEAVTFGAEVYAPINRRTGKFRTMAIAYQNYLSGSLNHCYEQGCARFPEFSELVTTFSPDDFDAPSVFTDIKFGNTTGVAAVALRIYLENLLWLGCLGAVLHGANKLRIRISYPRKEVYNHMQTIWQSVAEAVRKKCQLDIYMDFITEAESNYFYQRKYSEKMEEKVSVTNDFGIIDIGHGTSDMNFYFHSERENEPAKQVQISVRYAGERLLTETIYDYFRNKRHDFQSIWDLMPEADYNLSKDEERKRKEIGGRRLIEEYLKNAEKIEAASLPTSNVNEHGKRFSLESNQKNILITLLQDIHLRSNLSDLMETGTIKEFLLFMKFKYMNLFLVYADILGACPRSDSGNTFKFFLYGGGRHGIQTITGRPMDALNETAFGAAIKLALSSKMKIPANNINIISNNSIKKNEVVDGMLWKENISEQREVYSDSDEINTFLQSKKQHFSENIWNADLCRTLENEYNNFVSFYKKTDDAVWKNFVLDGDQRKVRELYWYITIKEDSSQNAHVRQLIKRNRQFFNSTVQRIWEPISKDHESPTEIQYCLFCCYMSEAILLEHLR